MLAELPYFVIPPVFLLFFILAKEHYGRKKCAAEESETSVSGLSPLFLPDSREALLCP